MLQVILKRWLYVVPLTVLGLVAAAVWIYFAPRVYTSSVNIQIDPQETILPVELVVRASSSPV